MHYFEVRYAAINTSEVLCLVRDISESRKAEIGLAESENRLRTILNTEPECVKILNRQGEVIEMNPAGLAMIEADSLEQIKGRSVLGIVNDSYKNAFSELTKNVFNGKSGNLAFEITGLKGTKRWLETHAVPFKNADGDIISLLGVTRDITERKKAKKLLEDEKFVLEMIAKETQVEDVLNRIALNFESYSKDSICSILLLNEEGTHVMHGAGPSLPDEYNKGDSWGTDRPCCWFLWNSYIQKGKSNCNRYCNRPAMGKVQGPCTWFWIEGSMVYTNYGC